MMNQNPLESLRVLVVEDVLMVAAEIEHQLRSFGCEVIGPFSTVAEALSQIEHELPDAALLDVNLQGELGFPIADVLFDRRVPFIFMTGYSTLHLPLEYRAFPSLQKPFTGAQLREAFERVCVPQSK